MHQYRFLWLVIFFCCSLTSLSQGSATFHTINNDSTLKDSLLKIVKEQNTVLGEFKEIKDDILAEKVFEKSKSKIITWITFGGLFLLLVGIIGYWKIGDIVKGAVSKKIEEVSQKELKKEIEKQSNVYVEKLVSEKVDSLKLSGIADKIKAEGQTVLKSELDNTKNKFDSFVSTKKEEIEGLVIQLKQSTEALNNPLGSTQKTTTSRKTIIEKQADSKLDYSPDMLPVRDCGMEGSIVGFAIAYTVEYQVFKHLNKRIRISPRQIYYYSRINSGMDIKYDTGSFIKGGVKCAREHGVIEEKDWPYKAGEFNKKPPASEKNAMHYKVAETSSIKNLNEIKKSIKTNGPAVIGITVFESLYSNDHVNKDGIFILPKEKEEIQGAIAICLVGFDDERKLFKFINCWGKDWGDEGYGYVPYEYVQKYSDDGWALKGISAEV